MQRKNSFLRNSTSKKRSGMAMIMAIAVIVIIATIMLLSLSLTVQTTKKTTDIYLYEQAVLYSKSAAELALLAIAQNGCQDTFTDTLGAAGEIQYDVNVTMRYVYREASGCNEYISYIQTNEQNGSVLMDIVTTLHDSTIATEPIRYFRRSIQKL